MHRGVLSSALYSRQILPLADRRSVLHSHSKALVHSCMDLSIACHTCALAKQGEENVAAGRLIPLSRESSTNTE